jgi:hypothetical protein
LLFAMRDKKESDDERAEINSNDILTSDV